MKSKPLRSTSIGATQAIREVKKENDEYLTTLTFQLSKKLHKQFRATSSLKGEKMKDVITSMIKRYVEENKL